MRRFIARFSNLFQPRNADRELTREIASHLVLLQDDFERRGFSPQAAAVAARQAYGGIDMVKELHREARSFLWIEQRFKDVRYGARNLMRTPAFTAIAVITLALGIGANTAVFSVVNAVLVRPLAYSDPERLVTVLHYGTGPVAVENYLDWRDQSCSFQAMGAAEYWAPNLTGTDMPEHLLGLHVTQNLLPMLGVRPALGRLFVPGEDSKGAEHEVVLSHRLWQRRFNLDPGVVGKVVNLSGEPYTVVGVMPAGFQFAPFWATGAELWAPLAFGDRANRRTGNSLRIFARLKTDVPLQQARTDLATVTARLEKQFPATNRGVVVSPLRDNVVGEVEPLLLMLLGAVGFVLLIACANVAHMLLARTSDRQKEIAVRTALGAGRARVIAQFLTENLVLAVLGAGTGLVLAYVGTKALVALSPATIPRVESVGVDSNVVLFLLAITAVTTALFGLAPAMRAVVANLSGALKEGGREGSDRIHGNRLRGFLVASEFALAFMLLIGAGLMIRSFSLLQSVNPGFDPHNVLSMVVSVDGTGEAETGKRAVFYRQLLDQIRSLPGVRSAGAINHLPLHGDLWDWNFKIEGRPDPRPGDGPHAIYRIVMPGYFETMRLPLLRGRAIADADDERAAGVVVISERAASKYWHGQNPVGERVTLQAGEDGKPYWLSVIGVVANAKQDSWSAEPTPEVYLAALQNRDFMGTGDSHMAYITLVVRTGGNPSDMASAVRKVVWSFDRNLPISEVVTMDEVVAEANAQPRFEVLLLGVFAVVALLLAAVGIYGVMSYSVSRRTREIGIRVSLGANSADVLRMIVRQGMKQALTGTVVGVVGALLLARLMANMLYGVRPTDPVTFVSVAIVLGIVALLATLVSARKATRIEPLTALRSE